MRLYRTSSLQGVPWLHALVYDTRDSRGRERSVEGMLRVITRDNGPEIERRVVESGVEDPLEHGSGMGLWTVKWGVTQMAGSLAFAEATPRGTVVQLEVPATGD